MVVLPSSPVWYQSRGTDSSHNGILAFGSRNLVYMLDLNGIQPSVYGVLSGHSDKVTSCSFCPPIAQDQLLRLVSGSEDCIVKIWDTRQKLALQDHSAHGGNKIVTVHWSPVNSSLIVSGDEKGFVVCWNLDGGKTQRFDPDGTSQCNLCCLTCSSHNENIVAVGYKSGAVSLMDIKKNGNVIRKLRAHNNEIHGIVWMPDRNENLIQKGMTKDEDGVIEKSIDGYKGIIVTGSKDKTIKLWSISTGKCGRSLKVPTRYTKGRKVNQDVARLYTTVYWPSGSKTKFISSGYNGDLIMWDLHPDAESLFEILACQGHEEGHQRIVFNICSGSDPKCSIVTTSMDRQILHWTIPELMPSRCNRPDWTLPTLGGFVYSLAVSRHDPSILAIGVGDGMIRIWKTRSPKSAYDITTLWQGIKEKVMSLSWHPQKEGCLAFATEDGKVGVYDVLSMRPPSLAATYHLKPVYALSWGPVCAVKCGDGDKCIDTKTLNVYSCGGDGIIYQHHFKNMESDATNIDKIIEANNPGGSLSFGKHSEVSWSNDNLLLAVGNDNGSIQVFTSPYLEHILTIKCHTKIVNRIAWKPCDNGGEDDGYQIATGSNNSTIFIHDLKSAFLDHNYSIGDKMGDAIFIMKPSKTLMGHISRITGISYNSRNPSEVVSTSYDGTAQVWNTETEKPLHNYRSHNGRLMCAAWSSVISSDSNKCSGIIYTGADDYTVHGWYAEDQEHTEPVKVLPDFGFGPRSKFQTKKKARQKKGVRSTQSSSPNITEVKSPVLSNPVVNNGGMMNVDHNLEILLEKRKSELLSTIEKDEAKISDSVITTLPQQISIPLQSGSETGASYNSKPVCDINNKTPIVNDDEQGKRPKRKLKNMFPQAVSLDNRKKSSHHKDCLKIVKWKMAQDLQETANLQFVPGDQEHLNLGFYTDRRAAFRMMKLESDKLQADEFIECSTNIKLWMGDVVGAINEAAERHQLTDQLVAMAPFAGQSFWRVVADKFARQLIAEGHHMHAVQYLLICDRLEEAVQVLLDGRHYREAVSLVRTRFCDDDPLLKKTVKAWANKLKAGGSVELAAKCFASIGEFEEAACVLSQRATLGSSTVPDSDIASLWAAASIAKCAENTELCSGYANRALSTVCCRTWDWEYNQQILSSYPNLLEYSFISLVHEIIQSQTLAKSLVGEVPTMKRSYLLSGINISQDSSFVVSLLHAWCKNSGKSGETTLCEQMCEDILKETSEEGRTKCTENKFLLQLSVEVAVTVCSACRRNHSESSLHSRTYSQEQLDTGSNWIRHAMQSFDLLSKSNCSPEIQEELISVICSVVNWCTQVGTEEFNGMSDVAISSLPVDCHPIRHRQEAAKILLSNANAQFDYLRPYLNAKLTS